jgi:hypothetical protein
MRIPKFPEKKGHLFFQRMKPAFLQERLDQLKDYFQRLFN